jgi:pimeloyl-ACP methyl ester carboxylesterase
MKWISVFLLFAASAFAQQTPAAVTADPPQQTDRKFAARMVELHVPALDASGKPTGELMNGIMYIAAGPGRHPTVILLHGFPGNEQNIDLAQSIRRAGWNVLYFHYRGAWGSQGDFSFANATQDTWAAIRFVQDPENVQRYNIDPRHVVLVGHSMGGFMAAAAAKSTDLYSVATTRMTDSHPVGYNNDVLSPSIAGVVLLSPWDLGRAAGFLADKPENKKYIADATEEFRGYQLALHGFTAEGGIAEIRAHEKQWQLTTMAPQIVQRNIPVLLTYGQFEDAREEGFTLLRDAFQKAAQTATLAEDSTDVSRRFTTVVLPTDHAYSDQRIALQSAIVNWLERFKPTIAK